MESPDECIIGESNVIIGAEVIKLEVCNSKKTLLFYVDQAKKQLLNFDEIEIWAIESAIEFLVSVAVILKNSDYAVIKDIQKSTVVVNDEFSSDKIKYRKMEILMERTISETPVESELTSSDID
ncbi:hypothetical protein ZOSMA_67G00260 [Zostera marina]|uniref:DNA/RNA-binding protein Alba-like domain-containing protein n=1 Tax=Zostera marina TaxID=29655 RepID=A0A0K9NSF6_ZOSMR|nr:hypothetical protein ZOSMA_67G00260 [Zostera marina]